MILRADAGIGAPLKFCSSCLDIVEELFPHPANAGTSAAIATMPENRNLALLVIRAGPFLYPPPGS